MGGFFEGSRGVASMCGHKHMRTSQGPLQDFLSTRFPTATPPTCTRTHSALLIRNFRDSQVLSLADVVAMAGGQPIDYLDLDVQSAELELLAAPGALELIREHVRRVQVGTHSTAIHNGIKDLLGGDGGGGERRGGFILENELVYNARSSVCDQSVKASVQRDASCLTATPYGPVYVRDGLLAFTNADPRVWPRGILPNSLW